VRFAASMIALFLLVAPAYAHTAAPLQAMQAVTVYVREHATMTNLETGTSASDNNGACSGFVVQHNPEGEAVILTAAHCVGKANETIFGTQVSIQSRPVFVKWHDGRQADVKWAVIDANDDVAAIIADDQSGHPDARLSVRALQPGEPLFVYGAANGRPWWVSQCYASGGDSGPQPGEGLPPNLVIFACLVAGQGDSGAPVFVDEGDIVGLLVDGNGDQQAMVPASRLIQFLLDLSSQPRVENAGT